MRVRHRQELEPDRLQDLLDPTAELHQWYGRFHYYGLDEVEPLADEESDRAEAATP